MYRGVLPAALFFRIFVSTGSPNDRTSGRKNREHGKIDPQFRPDRRRRLPDIGTRNDARRRVVAQTAILRTPAQRILAHHGRTLRTGTSGRVPASESYAAGDANRALGRLPTVRERRQPRQKHKQRRTEPHRGTATAIPADPHNRFQRAVCRAAFQTLFSECRSGNHTDHPAVDQSGTRRSVGEETTGLAGRKGFFEISRTQNRLKQPQDLKILRLF